MSKIQKLIDVLIRIPPPRDFRWDNLVTLMRQAGFSDTCDGGSHYTFEHAEGFRFTMSKTHPEGVLKAYQVRDAKEALRRVGFLEE